MTTKLELKERAAKGARLLAQGASKAEGARMLGISRSTFYEDMKRYQEESLEHVNLNPEQEAAEIRMELDKLLDRRALAERVLDERTEKGSKEYAALLNSITRMDQQIDNLRMDLGLWKRAPLRTLTLPGDKLSDMEDDALDAYIEQLEQEEERLAELCAPRRRATSGKRRSKK